MTRLLDPAPVAHELRQGERRSGSGKEKADEEINQLATLARVYKSVKWSAKFLCLTCRRNSSYSRMASSCKAAVLRADRFGPDFKTLDAGLNAGRRVH
ncbi:hypothetical protein ACFZAG_25070 [Streptomyces sp. NPDC012403]|uniref:hypothetical protein n=1 Tax=unclassified Streptomyces TaxID=2593676 RepID=UPI001C210962|nr:hypothetical protein [Streptomyces sp. AC558_RSS880]